MSRIFSYKRHFALLAALCVSISTSAPAKAQSEPSLPEPLQALRTDGAQMRYLGETEGLQGWIAIRNGQEQYFYVMPETGAFISGVLFDKEGRNRTIRQVFELQQSSEGETLALFAEEEDLARTMDGAPSSVSEAAQAEQRAFRTPSEQLYYDIENANWIALGKPDAPVVYSFIDPQCPHCHEFIKDLRGNYIENGLIQLRMIPVGFRPETRAQAAFLLAVPNPQKRWYDHLEGKTDALPITSDINQQGVERNLSVMQSWKINATPFSVYRDKGGEVKIVQGRARNITDIISDLN